MLRPAEPKDTSKLIALAVATGLFTVDEADYLLGGVLERLFAGNLGTDHVVCVAVDSHTDSPTGWAYFARNNNGNQVWDLWWIGVDPAWQRQGVGATLLRFVETHVKSAGGRLLIIETSALPALVQTRRFYARQGYAECGVVPDYYADGDDRVTFVKRMC